MCANVLAGDTVQPPPVFYGATEEVNIHCMYSKTQCSRDSKQHDDVAYSYSF